MIYRNPKQLNLDKYFGSDDGGYDPTIKPDPNFSLADADDYDDAECNECGMQIDFEGAPCPICDHAHERGHGVTRAVRSGALTYYETEPLDADDPDWQVSPDYDELQGYESPDVIDVEDLTEYPLAVASARARSRFPGIVGRGPGRGVMRKAAPKRKKAKRKTAVKPPNRSKRPSNVFISAANHYGLNPDIYRTRIIVGGKAYSIRYLYKKATKNQVGLVTIPHDDGNEWLITALALKQLLTRNGIDWRP